MPWTIGAVWLLVVVPAGVVVAIHMIGYFR